MVRPRIRSILEGDPALTRQARSLLRGRSGKRVPQVPSYNAGTGIQYTRQPWTASAQLRVTGAQFEDDQNVFALRRATVVDVFAGRTLARQISVFAAVENLFDSIYDVGRTPVLTTGLPRTARVGLRVFLP